MTDELKITLPLYEGPLDLLLDMIRRQKLDIYDIPIARVTEQYLEYLHFMQDSTWMSRRSSSHCGAIDLHQVAHAASAGSGRIARRSGGSASGAGAAAAGVREVQECGADAVSARDDRKRVMVQSRARFRSRKPNSSPNEGRTIRSPARVSRVIKRAEEKPTMEVTREEFSIEQMMGFLFDNIAAARGPITLTELLPKIGSQAGLDHCFPGLLELTRLQAIFLMQEKAFGEITARANPNYELSRSFSPA